MLKGYIHLVIDVTNYLLAPSNTMIITNELSQVVYTTQLNQAQFIVDLTTWTGQGTYFVYVYDQNNVLLHLRKIILQQ